MILPDTPTQAKARVDYDEACHALATASVALREAKAIYAVAHERYMRAFGAARQAGVIVP